MSTIRVRRRSTVRRVTRARRTTADLADHRRVAAQRVRPHRRQRRLGVVAAGPRATSLPSLARYSGSRPRISQTPRTSCRIGSAVLVELDRHARRRGELVQHRRQRRRASRRAGSACPGPRRASRRSARAAARSRSAIGICSASSPRAPRIAAPWSPSAPLTITTSPGARAADPELAPRRDDADAGGVDEQLVGRAAVDDLGVAGDDLHAGLARPPRAMRRQPRGAGCRSADLLRGSARSER